MVSLAYEKTLYFLAGLSHAGLKHFWVGTSLGCLTLPKQNGNVIIFLASKSFKKSTVCERGDSKIPPKTMKIICYRKISIDRQGGIHFLSTHYFWIIHKRTKINAYSKRVETFLSEYAFIIVLWQVVEKLCVEKKWIPHGLSIEFLQ
jgi:hypothetical protein